MSEQRIIDLETKISFQEQAIEEMQQSLRDQYALIHQLELKLKVFKERFEASGLEVAPTNEKPPHY